VTFTARVTVVAPATGIPTGTVQFKVNGVPAVGGVRTLNAAGVATFASSTVPGGINSIVAVYSGDAAFSTSISPTVSQTITKANSTTTLTSSANPSSLAVNSTVTFTARVTPLAAVPGQVQFTKGGINVGLPVLQCDTSGIGEQDELEVDLAAGEVRDKTTGAVIPFVPLPPVMVTILNDGGLVAHVKKHGGFALPGGPP
jgi:hypothetical protein